MKKRSVFRLMVVVAFFVFWAMVLPGSTVNAQEKLQYSRSAQVGEAFGKDSLTAFEKETGINVEIRTSSSASAVYWLMNGFSDIGQHHQGTVPAPR